MNKAQGKRTKKKKKNLNIKILGASEFKNNTVSHSQSLYMTINSQIKNLFQSEDQTQEWTIKFCYQKI